MLTSPTFCHICMTLHFCLFWPTPYEWLTGNKLALKNIGTQNLFSKQFGQCYLQSSRILSSTVTQKSKHHSKTIFVKTFKLPKVQTIIQNWGLTLGLSQTLKNKKKTDKIVQSRNKICFFCTRRCYGATSEPAYLRNNYRISIE